MRVCAGLTFAKSHAPAQLLTLPPQWDRQRKQEELEWEGSWIESKTERSLVSYHHGQNRLNIGNINLLPSEIHNFR